ncbi:MAG: hypothetical protein ACOH1P_12645 [Lysobacter sp.]
MNISRLYTRTKLDLFLGVVALICFWLMLSASSDPFIPWISGTAIAAAFEQFNTGNQIAFDLSVGVLSAIGMFYLLVRLPEYERKTRIKRHLNFSYQSFKKSSIQIFVGAVQGSYNTEIIDRLMNQKEFRDFFKEPYVPGQNKWHGVANKMDDFLLRQLVLEAEVLLNEFQHALSVLDIKDPETYAFMKRLSEALYRAKNWSSDYDGVKEVLGFFWSVLSGWSGADGYQDGEYIPDMIAKL